MDGLFNYLRNVAGVWKVRENELVLNSLLSDLLKFMDVITNFMKLDKMDVLIKFMKSVKFSVIYKKYML